MSPEPGRWRWLAIRRAAAASSVRKWSRIAQPTTFAGREIEHSGEIEPTLAGGHIGEIGEPDLVRGRRYEALLDQVGSDGQPMVAVRGHGPEAARGRGPDPVLVHEALDPTPADAPALSPQRGMHSRRAVAAPVLSMQASHIGQQVESGSGSRALGPAPPGVVAGSRDAEHLAYDAHRPLLLVIVDESEPHRGVSEKMPMAFFKMSRSARARSSSRRSRAFSDARSAGVGVIAVGLVTAIGTVVRWPEPWIAFCQRLSCEGWRPSSTAIST